MQSDDPLGSFIAASGIVAQGSIERERRCDSCAELDPNLVVADLAITTLNPWAELRRLLTGILHPDVWSIEALSVIYTVAFAVLGVAVGATAGFCLAIAYPLSRLVRAICVDPFLQLRICLITSPLTSVRRMFRPEYR